MTKPFCFIVFVTSVMVTAMGIHSSSSGNVLLQEDSSPSWKIIDIISPTLEDVEWTEKGNYSEPPRWISDGRWYEAHMRQSLAGSNSIFVALSESLNWTAVNAGFSSPYSSFDVFSEELSNDPSWWLKYSWAIDAKWHGVPLNGTIIRTEFDAETSKAEIFIWCRITNIPEYILGENRLETLLTGFDLTPIFIGKIESLQWYADYTSDGRYYYVYFKAPSKLMSQIRDSYSVDLEISPLYQGETYNVEQKIEIYMPPNTEIQETSSWHNITKNGNEITFGIERHDRYPISFSVTSAIPKKDPMATFLENTALWITEPSGWVAIVSLVVICYTAFRGGRMWNRRRTYYRLYRSMVSVYDHYSADYSRFTQEIGQLSATFLRYFVEDKITDEQFERLLHARDSFAEKASSLPPPPPK